MTLGVEALQPRPGPTDDAGEPKFAERCPNPACASPDLYQALLRADAYEVAGQRRMLRYRYAVCRSCGLGFVDPSTSAEVLASFYKGDYDYHQPHDADESMTTSLKYRVARQRYRGLVDARWRQLPGALLARVVETLARRDVSFSLGIPLALGTTARVLDYGFGSGQWLLTLQRMGYRHLYGHDIPQNADSADGLRRHGIPATSGDVASAFPGIGFDCVRLEHVFEHLLDPIAVLRSLRGLLRPGGFLALTVPSIHAWEPVESLAQSPATDYLQLPIHQWHHSSRSLADFLEAAGLDVVAVRMLRPYRYLSGLARRSAGDS